MPTDDGNAIMQVVDRMIIKVARVLCFASMGMGMPALAAEPNPGGAVTSSMDCAVAILGVIVAILVGCKKVVPAGVDREIAGRLASGELVADIAEVSRLLIDGIDHDAVMPAV